MVARIVFRNALEILMIDVCTIDELCRPTIDFPVFSDPGLEGKNLLLGEEAHSGEEGEEELHVLLTPRRIKGP
jgi:hypothetical protein